jgi:hypothetical protein
MDVAWAELRPFAVSELVEQEKRMIASLIPRPHDAKLVERMEFEAPTASVGTLLLVPTCYSAWRTANLSSTAKQRGP